MATRRVDAAHDRLDARGGEVFAFDDIVDDSLRRVAQGTGDSRLDIVRAHEEAVALVSRLLDEERRSWSARRACETAIGVINEYELHALDVAIGLSQSAFRQLTNRPHDSVPPAVAYAVSSQAVRAHATGQEICALLRAGLPNGAFARWRTLHEVNVVSAVLLAGNRHTAQRFNSHRWVMFARDAEHAGLIESYWSLPGPTPEVMRARLVKKYGRQYAQTYGWAAEVTKRRLDIQNPKWHHLEKLAQLAPRHGAKVKTAHHLVHADSLGVLHSIDSTGLLHSGATLQGIAEIAWQTVDALSDTSRSLIAIWGKYDSTQRVSALSTLLDESLSQLEVAGARAAAR